MAKGSHTKKYKNPGKRRVLLILEIVCIIIALVCVGLIIKEVSKYWVANNEFNEIVNTYDRNVDALETDNPNCVGWIKVSDTRIDYPVMYTPDDPEYYLHRNFEGEYSASGTPFLGAGSDPHGNSLIIYGHHMNDGSMFAELVKFDKEDFGLSHTIEFKTLEGLYTYKVLGCFYEDLSSGGAYEYWKNVGTIDEQTFNDYVAHVKSVELYDTGVSAVYGDDLLTLSTCSYGTAEERFVVVAVREKTQ